jgi:N-methylhydantoinase A
MDSKLSVGVDVGGTFTDIVSMGPRGLTVLKLPTSSEPSLAVIEGLRDLGHAVRDASLISHATTLATNALLTRSGLARAVLLTNEGFRDVLEIGRQRRPELYNLTTRRPVPLVPREDRLPVRCRIAADGTEVEPLSRAEARAVAARVVKSGPESVAICFLNSYANDRHEVKMRDALLRGGFRGHVSISSEVDREFREFERTSTTVVNAVLAPMMAGYLSSLKASLERQGIRAPVYVMGSDGGATTMAFAASRPVGVIESGPAAGVIASRQLARALGLPRVLTFDMGGTTAKAGAVIGGEAGVVGEFEAAGRSHSGRSIGGSGYPVRGEFVDLAEVSAGGGTVAWVDDAGELQVGPASAGSTPGPACYNRGGKDATVTDANVVLGRLSPDALLGGTMKIRRDLALAATKNLAGRLGIPVDQCGRDILRLVNDSMARALSVVSTERGRDPRDFTLMAFGGGGPGHACDVAEELGMRDILVPPHPGLFSAYGLLAGEFSRSFVAPVMSTKIRLGPAFQRLERGARTEMRRGGFGTFALRRYLDAHYVGQSHELTLPYFGDYRVRDSFDSMHADLYGYSASDDIEVVSIRLKAVAAGPGASKPGRLTDRRTHKAGARIAWIGGETCLVPVLPRESLLTGSRGRGPCIVEEYDSTLVVNSSWDWRSEAHGLRLTR